jgi:phospholipid/cholesterol/gamma-HCH transport system substrate-binding protein
MRRTRADAIRVGLFVLVAGALLGGGLLWIAGSSFLRPVARYEILFEKSVSGLNAGADVQSQGVVVGRVRDIRLTHDIPPKVAVAVDLVPGTSVQTDTTAVLVGSLVTGIRFIELTGGTPAAGRLEPGGWIPGTVPSFEKLGEGLQSIADRVDGLLKGLQEQIFTEGNAQKLTELVSDLRSVVHKLDATMSVFQTEQTGKDLAALARDASSVAKHANEALADFQGRREGLYGGLNDALRELGAAAGQTRELASRTQSELATTAGSIETLLAELTRTADRLREAVDVIGSDPGVLLRGRPVPEREFAR